MRPRNHTRHQKTPKPTGSGSLSRFLRSRCYRKSPTCWACDAYHPTTLLLETRDGQIKFVHFGERHIWTRNKTSNAERVLRILFPQDFPIEAAPTAATPTLDPNQSIPDEIYEEVGDLEELGNYDPSNAQEAIDPYLTAIETGEVNEDAFAAAVLLLETTRRENQALKLLLQNPQSTEVTCGYVGMQRHPDDQPHENQRKLARFIGSKTFTKAELLTPAPTNSTPPWPTPEKTPSPSQPSTQNISAPSENASRPAKSARPQKRRSHARRPRKNRPNKPQTSQNPDAGSFPPPTQ